jgi:crotonobetainyl-CoA:carnitine CoA-transferase CaiB-like acyl-CoA transferase
MTTADAAEVLQSPDLRSAVGWLAGTRVVVANDSLTAQIAGRVLGQFGADVVTVAEATGRDLLADADVLLVDRIAGPVPLPGLADGGSAAEYLEHVARVNRGVWVTASAYGLTTDRADAVGSDATVLASGGVLGHSRIGPDSPPTVPAGSISLSLVGTMMALAALHGLSERAREATPRHVDVSAQAAVVATGLTLEMAHALLDCPDEGGSARYGAPTGFFRCADGAIYVVVLEQHQWVGFQACLSPLLDDVATVEDARRRHEEVNAALATWAEPRRAEDCERLLQAAGVACTSVNSLAALAERSVAAGRPIRLGEPGAPVVPALVSGSGRRGAESAEVAEVADPRSLSGLRILDAGHVLAVPLATAWLGAMGARVDKLEDPGRLDVYRRRGPFAGGVAGLNRSAYFNAINFCKESVAVAVGAGQAVDLAAYDVVVHNLSPRRAVQVGVDGSAVLAAGHPLLGVSSSGFGGTGAWSSYRAYGHNIHAFAGLVAATRDAHGEMADVGTPWCDPLTSVGIAVWVSAWALAQDRDQTVAIDMSMSELMATQLAEVLGVTDRPPVVEDGREVFLRPRGTDRMLVLSLLDEGQRARAEGLLGRDLASSARGELVEVDLAGSPEAIEGLLLAEGLAASLVRTAPDLAVDPFLRGTGLFARVSSRDLGDYDVTGLPWRFVGAERAPLRAAPELEASGVV